MTEELLYDVTSETDLAVLHDEEDRVVVQIQAAWGALAEARTVEDIVSVTRGAELLRQYIKRAKLGLRAQNEAAALKVEATAKAGEMLGARDKVFGSRNQLAGRDASGGLIIKPPEKDAPTNDELGVSKFESHYWQKVARIPEQTRQRYYRFIDRNVDLAESEMADEVEKVGPLEITTSGALQYHHADVHNTSLEDEWLTPPEIIQRVLLLFGEIDLDPCSNTMGDPNVPARQRFTEADSGLERPWSGRVYMNPPYGKTIAEWMAKLHDEHEAGNVQEAIALVPARTDTEWWLSLRDTVVCLVRGRLRFSGSANSAPFPSAVAYFGERREDFAAAFDDLGDIWVRLEG